MQCIEERLCEGRNGNAAEKRLYCCCLSFTVAIVYSFYFCVRMESTNVRQAENMHLNEASDEKRKKICIAFGSEQLHEMSPTMAKQPTHSSTVPLPQQNRTAKGPSITNVFTHKWVLFFICWCLRSLCAAVAYFRCPLLRNPIILLW